MFYIGADYYPEDWDESNLDWDIEKLKENGFNIVRIGEFAWSKDEPKEGEYHFEWLHRIVDRLGENGIKVIMGTPTATPPAWLFEKYPDMAVLDCNGIRVSHGGRRHCCSSNPDYIRYSSIIVEKLAEEFGNDANIVGWQIDNEIAPKANGCVCPYCMERFHKFLKNKYGTVENLNKQWNLTLFSQWYDSFDQIPAPFNTWHNPHIKLDWKLSQAQNHVDFVHLQADILHKYTSAEVGTDTMPFNFFDYREMESKLDVCQFNHYNTHENIDFSFLWFDYLRKFSKKPFWNTETEPCWNGATSAAMSVQPENFIYFNTMLPYIFGGEANLFWLWRTHWAGHELMHGAVYTPWGRETYANDEIRRAARDMRTLEPVLSKSKVVSDSAMTFTSLNYLMLSTQDILHSLNHNYCDQDFLQFYHNMLENGIHPDVIDLKESLDGYKLIFSPLNFTLDEDNFEERITKWVQDGGVWVVGPLSDIRTRIGTHHTDSPYGFLEKLTGAYQKYNVSEVAPYEDTVFENNEGKAVKCTRSFELFSDNHGESLITVKKWNTPLVGLSCAKLYPVGKGYVLILGTFPEGSELDRIIAIASRLSGATRCEVQDVLITRFESDENNIIVASAFKGKAGTFRFNGVMRDELTGKTYSGSVSLEPYQIAVLSEIK